MGIPFSDLFYPGNPGRRDKVNELVVDIRSKVNSNISNVNMGVQLFDMDFKCDIKIIPNMLEKTIGEILNTIKEKFDELNTYAKKELDYLGIVDETELKILEGLQVDLTLDKAKQALVDHASNERLSTGIGICTTLYFGKATMAILIAFEFTLKQSVAGGLLLGSVLGAFADVIMGIVNGAKERDQLELVIKDLDNVEKTLDEHSGKVGLAVMTFIQAIMNYQSSKSKPILVNLANAGKLHEYKDTRLRISSDKITNILNYHFPPKDLNLNSGEEKKLNRPKNNPKTPKNRG